MDGEAEAAANRKEYAIAAQVTSTRESVLSRVDCGLVGNLAEALQDEISRVDSDITKYTARGGGTRKDPCPNVCMLHC